MANKVLFGFSDLYIGTYTEELDGSVTMGKPYHQPGAVGFNAEDQSSDYKFYADNVTYFSYYTSGTYEGDLTVAMFDDEFKKQFLGYIELDDGGLAQLKNAIKPNVYMAFEVQGDKEARRIIFYNGSLGAIKREYATIEENVEVKTEAIATSFIGNNKNKISMVAYKPGDSGYDTLFENPPAPKLPESQSE